MLQPQRVIISHPGYEGQNNLFMLPAREGPKRDQAHYATVLEACAIITDNAACNVWLSLTRNADRSEAINATEHLPAGHYFLHVHRSGDEADDTPYPIVPNFRAWRYPHETPPSLWEDAARRESEASTSADGGIRAATIESCRITTKELICEDAHILPTSEKPWFTCNRMDGYGQLSGRSGDTVADTWVNKMRLQVTAHRLWDGLQFAIVPRRSIETDNVAWYTQMTGEHHELEKDWHCKELQPLRGRAWQYLYARYAFQIFPRLHGFLQGGQPRWLVVHSEDGTETRKMYSKDECYRFTTHQGRGRSASPLKRARSAAAEGSADTVLARGESSATSESEDSAIGGVASRKRKAYTYPQDWNDLDDDLECERGRKRFRT